MTVAELIEELQKLPGNMRVLVQGYEGGYTEPKLGTKGSRFVYEPHDWCGEFEQDWYDSEYSFEAVVIAR